MKIIVDMMGGDNAPLAVLEGAAQAVKEYGVTVVGVGDEALVRKTAQEMCIRDRFFAFQPGIQAAGRQQAAGSAFHIALKAGDLARKEHIGVFFQAQLGAEHPGRIEEGVAAVSYTHLCRWLR